MSLDRYAAPPALGANGGAKIQGDSSVSPCVPASQAEDLAQVYAESGFAFFPCKLDKSPAINSWQSRATTDPEQIRALIDRAMKNEIAIGMVPPVGVIALDIDSGEALAELRKSAPAGWSPGSPVQRTGRGVHIMYHLPGGAPWASLGTSSKGLPKGVDARANGRGYIVVEPSMHKTGRRYSWRAPLKPIADLPVLPDWLQKLFRFADGPASGPAHPGGDSVRLERASVPYCSAVERAWTLAAKVREASEGERRTVLNNGVLEIAGVWPADKDTAEIVEIFSEAAIATGLELGIIEKTISDAIKDGLKKPLKKLKAGVPIVEQIVRAVEGMAELFPSGARRFAYFRDEVLFEINDSQGFTEKIAALWFAAGNASLPERAKIKTALQTLAAKAAAGAERSVFARQGELYGALYFGVGARVIAVTAEKIERLSRSEAAARGILFEAAHPNYGPREEPHRLAVDILQGAFPQLNDRPSAILAAAWAFGAVRQALAVPILSLTARHGGGKSQLAAFLAATIDGTYPGTCADQTVFEASLSPAPDSEAKLISLLGRNSATLVLDNISRLPNEFSDLLCLAVTGGKHTTRRLYTDNDLVVSSLKKAVIVTGISSSVVRGDLGDRTVSIELESPAYAKESVTDVHRKLVEAREELFWSLLAAVRMALANLAATPPVGAHRLSGWSQWCSAGAEALGFTSEELAAALDANRRSTSEGILEDDPLAEALLKLARPSVFMTAHFFGGLDHETQKKIRSARALGKAFVRIAPDLEQVHGVRLSRDPSHGSSRGWRISNIDSSVTAGEGAYLDVY